MKGNQIDDLFRQKLSHQKLNPPPAAWSAIEQNLPGKKKKGAYFWMSIAASILVIFTLGWLLLDKGQDSLVTEQDALAKTKSKTPVEFKTPAEAEKPAQTLVTEEKTTPEVLQESVEEPAVQKLVAKVQDNIDALKETLSPTDVTIEELVLRQPVNEVALIIIDKRMAPGIMRTELKDHMMMPLELSAYYIPYTEDLELSPKKKKFRVLNGIISIAKEVNSSKLSFSELRNAKNNWVVDDLKYGSKEVDSDTEDEPNSPEKE